MIARSSALLQKLNELTHPAVAQDGLEWQQACQGVPYTLKEAALLFESGTAEGLDYVIGVTAPATLRIKRVMDRDNVTADEVKRRMNNQLDESIKMKLCDFVLQNNEQQLLLPQIVQLHEELIRRSKEEMKK